MKGQNQAESGQDLRARYGSAAFQARYVSRDVPAGIITGAMAIPLSVGIAMMSDYPIKVGLATVAFAGFIGWFLAWFRPGNFIGSPGIAAGLAPILAMGVATFGIENMAFLIFLTASFQAVIWKFDLQRYILMAVPTYLVEGLLAGIGLKIFLNFLGFTYELPAGVDEAGFWSGPRLSVILLSLTGAAVFLWLFGRYKDSKPAIPYLALIVFGVVASQLTPVSMLHVEDVPLELALPIPDFDSVSLWLYAIGFALMLAVIDVIEQVMSNSAIEKIDPLGRKTHSNNSLLAIWIANMGSSFFGGMTNLDGLAKSTTNKLAGAYTKFSVLVIALVVFFFVMNVEYLELLPKFALGIIMMFVGWKMIVGLLHVAHHGPYALLLATFCGLLVYKVGIFEGLLIALAVHAVINYVIFRHVDSKPTGVIVRDYFKRFGKGDSGAD
ncbi:MAG: SulP family inorganic anion transporter [Halothiobacillaceae bacterium]